MGMPIENTSPLYSIKSEESERGFISLFRSIRNHWVWQDSEKLKWWIDILLEVNHKPNKVLIGGKLIECNRGQSLNSLLTWAKRWRSNPSRVRRFLKLLENDSMVVLENVSKTTRITVCKYDSYQTWRNDNETIMNPKRNARETQVKTNNNDNNDNKESGSATPQPKSFKKWTEKEFYDDIAKNKSSYSKQMLRDFYEKWTEKSASGKMKFQLQDTWETKKRLVTWHNNEDKFGATTKIDSAKKQEQSFSPALTNKLTH